MIQRSPRGPVAAGLILLTLLLGPASAQAQILVTMNPNPATAVPGSGSSFTIGITNTSASAISVGSYSVSLSIPNATQAQFTNVAFPSSNYVFSGNSFGQIVLGQTTPAIVPPTSTSIQTQDSANSPTSVSLGAGASANLFTASFTISSSTPVGTSVPITFSNVKFQNDAVAPTVDYGFSLPISPQIQAVPEPSALLLTSAVAVGWGACLYRRRRRAAGGVASAPAAG
jgi:hypothetical protein